MAASALERTLREGAPEHCQGGLHHLGGAEGHDDSAQDDTHGLQARSAHRIARVHLRNSSAGAHPISQLGSVLKDRK